MRRCSFFLFALFVLTAQGVYAGPWSTLKGWLGMGDEPKAATIKVLLASDVDGAMLEVTGAYNVYDHLDGRRLATRFTGKKMFIQPMENGIKWGEEFPHIYQVTFVPDDRGSTILVNGEQYRGEVSVFQVEGRLHIVNDVAVDDYVQAVLESKFTHNLGEEAMNSLAIVERTHAYYLASQPKNPFWHVRAEDVGYEGYGTALIHNGVDLAVSSTKGMVLSRGMSTSSPNYFAATWTEHSGGKTVPYHLIFRKDGNAPENGVRASLAARGRADKTWAFSIGKKELATLLGLTGISSFKPFSDGSSKKVYALRFRSGSTERDVDFLALQKLLGQAKLQSAEFSIDVRGETVYFKGVGKGHGVGLCVYSAEKMAKEGASATEILSVFFPDTSIVMAPEFRASQVKRDVAERHRARERRVQQVR